MHPSEKGNEANLNRLMFMNGRPIYYDRQGNPLLTWGARVRFGSPEQRRVDETTVGDLWVSTVHLVMDHGYGEGPPIIFETMVFGPGGEEPTQDARDEWTRRYHTEEEAREGHAEIVAALREEASDWGTDA